MPVTLPRDLKKRLAERRVILFAGAGMSIPPLTGWGALLEGILAEGLDVRTPSLDGQAARIRELIKRNEGNDLLDAAQLLRDAMERRDFVRAIKRLCTGTGGLRQQIVASLPLAAILTTNFDLLIEEALPPEKRRRVLRQTQTTELIHAVRDSEFAVVHLHGDVSDSESIVLTAADFDAVKRNEPLEHFIDTFSTTHTFLFVGYGLSDPDLLLFLEKVFAKSRKNSGPHWALQHKSKLDDAKRKEFSEKYGIRFIENDRDGSTHPDLDGFLAELAAAVPVPPEVDRDILKLFEEAGYRDLEPLPDQDGRLVCKALLRGGVDYLQAAIGYTHRQPREADYAALRSVEDAEVCHLVCSEKPDASPPPGIKLWTREEFLTRMMPSETYRRKLRSVHEDPAGDEIEKYYVNLRVRRRKDEGQPEELDHFVDRWLADASGTRKHLSILGEFGTGKSWFTRHFCYRAAGRSEGRIPILLQLNKWAERFDVRSLVTDALVNEHGFNVDARVFHRLNQEGRLLLIFDGFDEMVRDANNPRTASDNFEALAALAEPERAKIVLTCRTEFFATEKDERNVLHIKTEDDWIKRHHGFECAYLQLFDDDQVKEALANRGLNDLFQRLKGMGSLFGLAHKPVLLQMVLETRDQWVSEADFTMASLYEKYTESMIQRRPAQNITAADRRVLIDDAAWRIQSQQEGVRAKAFDEMVRDRFKSADEKELLKRVSDLQSQASYFRREGDIFAFAHKSFREYFVARRLAAELLAGKVSNLNLPLTDVIAGFVAELLAGKFQPVVEEDGAGMVKVPVGPFIYGNEGRKNLRIGETTADFWIDRNPVTNELFAAFLKDAKKPAKVLWIDHDRSRIKAGLRIDPGFERHPVVGVTWFGADAYAKSVPGRRLPTEEEWEKAARGIDGREYPWGGTFKKELCNTKEDGPGRTTEVGSYPQGASPYGVLDNAGNVNEWTASDWREGSPSKVLRGGAWNDDSSWARCAIRNCVDPDDRYDNLGFRCART